MSTNKTISFLLLLLICMPTIAQLEDGTYNAFKPVKEDKQPDVITINILTIGNKVKQYNDAVTKKGLDGTYHIALNHTRYVIGNFKKGIAHGDWTQYWNNDEEEKGTFKNGKYDGLYVVQTTSGHDEYVFKDGVVTLFVSWHKNGQLEREQKYDENGKIHGEVTAYNSDGKIRSRSNYLHGKPDGPQMNANGYIEHYTVRDRVKIGEYSKTGLNGGIYEKGVFDQEGNKTGKWLYGNGNGNGSISREENYRDNKLHGEKKQYYSNGKLWIHEMYTDGKRNGKSLEYSSQPHEINKEINYKNDERHGELNFYRNGVLQQSSLYREGKEVMTKEYYNGKLVTVRLLDETGRLVKVEGYNRAGKKDYKNTTFKKHPSIRLKENASGVIDIEFE